MSRVLAIWLDGFSMSLADEWELPTLARLGVDSARAVLDHDDAHLTGLSGEHLATGLDPLTAERASAVRFDPKSYDCVQEGVSRPPAFGGVPSVVIDPCYFDLGRSHPDVRGIVDWGAHDPGGPPSARPEGLLGEVEQRYGAYPAKRWVYATPWASSLECTQMGVDLTKAVRRRTEIASWLLGERLPDWQIALVGVSEAHSATEGLYHGIDQSPRWQSCPSRRAARCALRSVYEAIDRLVGDLCEQFPGDLHVVFSLHGMGPNSSDVPSMVLLGELLRRWSGDATPEMTFPSNDEGVPLLTPGRSWSRTMSEALDPPTRRKVQLARVARALSAPVRPVVRRARGTKGATRRASSRYSSLGWMPVMRHQLRWPTMRAFAIPSFYDGRLRVNVVGRESNGNVHPGHYHGVLDEIENLLRDCRDPLTGQPVVATIDRLFDDPMLAGPTDADLVIGWAPDVLGFFHPQLGTIGPVPPRRTGGHSSPIGRCMVHGPGVAANDLGRRSSFDVLPTILTLADSPAPWPLSGEPMPVPI